MTASRTPRVRGRTVADGLRTQLWPAPAVAIVVAVALGVAMPMYDLRLLRLLPSGLGAYLFGGGPEAARAVLQAIAGSLITVTSLTFSLTIVTLQLASGQYSPRLLRTFARDRVVHATLAVLLATFTYALTVLRTVRAGDDAGGAYVPRLSVTMAYLLALVSVMTVAGFLAHLARKIRVESMLRDVHAEAKRTVHRVLPAGPRSGDSVEVPAPPDDRAVILSARTSGFVTSIDERKLWQAALDAGAVVRFHRLPGASVVAGTPVASAWPVDDRQRWDDGTRDVLHRAVGDGVRVGFERTAAQDVAFGLRQLTDVAAKALSPGVNDPTTAIHALGHSAALLCDAAGRDLGPRVLRDDEDRVRLFLPRPDLAILLDLAVSQPRRYGAGHPEVLARLFGLLREVAWVTRDHAWQDAVAGQLARLRATVAAQPFDHAERVQLEQCAELAEAALLGRWPLAG